MSTCSFGGCGRRVFSGGLCNTHYKQRQSGVPLRPLQNQIHGLSEYDRFMARVAVGEPADCWPWTASRQNGWHGQWRNAASRHELAHRAAWRLLRGAIPEGMFILHRCDNPVCCNPSHLFMGSQSDNARDMWDKRRANPGTSIGEDHGMSKLTAAAIRYIRRSDESGVALAAKYGVAPATITDIRKRRTWKHIT